MGELFFSIDLPALLTIVLSVICCSLLGTFLLLRKESMMSDSLSHAVLPGIAGGFLISGAITPLYMVGGAFVACLACILLIALVRRYARLDNASAMGLVFTSLFALGLFLLEHEIGSKVHLDAHHALYGALELIYWPSLKLQDIPQEIPSLLLMAGLITIYILMNFRGLRMVLFDPEYAKLSGFKAFWVEWPLFFLIAGTIVLSFNAVGSILVIALFVCPPAVARLFCDDLRMQLIVSVLVGIGSVVLGYTLASWVPEWLGFRHSLSAGGMIAWSCALVLIAAVFWQRLRRA